MLVTDASVIISALFPDERQPAALALYQAVLDGEETATVPPIFPYEVCNVIMQSLRRRRIDAQAANEYLDMICDFPIQIDARQAMPDVIALCEKHALTVYDAAYLELAKRLSLPLATLDEALTAAAKREKVALVMD